MKTKHLKPLVFAILMSCTTAMLVSAAILLINGVPFENFIVKWLKSVSLAWPLVFVAILTIAPMINRLLDKLFKDK